MALDKGESIKQQMIQMERAIQVYQAEKVGPQGELMKKSAQLNNGLKIVFEEACMILIIPYCTGDLKGEVGDLEDGGLGHI